MSLPHQSVAAIKSPEFINLTPLDINPLMSACDIKVLYIGKNRNGSVISKETAEEMAKTLRGAPIVGYYKEKEEDFGDHGDQMIIDGDGIRFNCLTKPYGFVSPDAKVWFQDFEDTDEINNQKITRTYLMTTGFLWTGQFSEVQDVIDNGRPQSMELDEKSLQGKWATDYKTNRQFFIINDAIFSKLCILGQDIEPCFQGAAITAPEVSTSFTLDQNFKSTLFSMMNDLKQVLKGGYMAEEKIIDNNITDFSEENQDKNGESISEKTDFTIEGQNENSEVNMENQVENDQSQVEVPDATDPAPGNEFNANQTKEDNSSESTIVEDGFKEKYSLLESQYNELQDNYNSLKQEVEQLREFKLQVDNEKKDELISQFFMLSDEDKKDVIENKVKYTLDEIKSKLAVICFEKKVNFNLTDSYENEDSMKESEKNVVTTFNINNQEDLTPDWVKEVELHMNGKN